jgi:hypothetical protein
MSDNWENYETDVKESSGRLETDREYIWDILDITLQKDVIIGGKDMREAYSIYRGKTLADVPPSIRGEILPKWTANYLTIHVVEINEGIKIKMPFNISKMTINEKNPKFESKLVTFIRNLGHTIEPGNKLRLGNYLKKGKKFYAKVIPQKNHDGTDSGFHEIDITSVSSAPDSIGGMRTSTTPTSMPDSKKIDDNTKQLILSIISGAKNKDEAIKKIFEDREHKDLISEFLTMCSSGEIKF